MSIRLFAACGFALLAACTRSSPHAPDVPPSERRVAALVPSLAEDLYVLGAGDRVVGVSRFTDVAPRSVARVADFQSVDTERIVALHPDLVVALPSQERLLEPLRHAGVRTELIRDDTFEDIFSDLHELGVLTGTQRKAGVEIARLRAETARLRASRKAFRRRPTVFVALSSVPIWTAGPTSYIGKLIALAGGSDAADLSQPWGEFSEEALVRANPDAIVAGSDANLRAVLGREPWRSLRAVREGHVFIITDPHIVNALYRPGPRYNEGLRWLIERLSALAN